MASLNRISHVQKSLKEENPEFVLRRSVLSCLLWEKEFYEDGIDIAKRIQEASRNCSTEYVSNLALEARNIHGLRHVPLLLLLELVRRGGQGVKHTIAGCIRRPDEMTELLNMYWMFKQETDEKGKRHLSDRQLRDGLKLAFEKFNEYSLAKYDRDGAVRIRDVMFLCHPKPKNEEQAALFKRIANKEMKTPDTWEVELSAGKDKKEVFERLIKEEKLGYLALLRNLRNMLDAGCDLNLMANAILKRKGAELVFPFRYVAAARAAPRMEEHLDQAMQASIKEKKPLSGTTLIFVDVSGSMRGLAVSARSDMDRVTAAATLASIVNCERKRVFSFANRVMELPGRMGMAGVDSIVHSQNGGTKLADAIDLANSFPHDRVIFITDEQDTTGRKIPNPVCDKSYMINVASYRNGVDYRKNNWIKLDGFSESVLKFIYAIEDMK